MSGKQSVYQLQRLQFVKYQTSNDRPGCHSCYYSRTINWKPSMLNCTLTQAEVSKTGICAEYLKEKPNDRRTATGLDTAQQSA